MQIPRRFVRSAWGGTETAILATTKCLQAAGHHVEILCPRALADCDRETIDGVHVTRSDYFYPYLGLSAEARKQLDRKGGNLYSFSLARELKHRPDADVLHLHTGKRLGGIVRQAARRLGVPYVISLHGGALDVPPAEAATWTEPTKGTLEWGKVLGWWVGSRKVLQDAAAILCVGKGEHQKMQQQFPGHRVVYLPNGVEADRFATGDGAAFRAVHDISPDAAVILCVGRIDPQKNQLLAVRAMGELVAGGSDACLVLVGATTNQAYHAQLTAEIDRLGLAERVRLTGQLDCDSGELADAYHAADVFLLPSAHEPFGIVILEAWAAGLPVAASRVGGVPFFVVNGEDGLLFESDDVTGCVSAVRSLLKSPARAREIALAGQVKAREEYSWQRITDRLMEVYEEVTHASAICQ